MAKIVLIFESQLDPNGGPNKQIFVEAHDENGNSIDVGEWAADGEYETLTIDCDRFTLKPLPSTPVPVYAGQPNKI
jgi:hypothetical protein